MRESGKHFGSERYNHPSRTRSSPGKDRRLSRRRTRSRSPVPFLNQRRRSPSPRDRQSLKHFSAKLGRDSLNFRNSNNAGDGRGLASVRSRTERDSGRSRKNGGEDGRRMETFGGNNKGRDEDHVVKRTRTERSPPLNRKDVKSQGRTLERWGHSGFNELYRDDTGTDNRNDSKKKSRSRSRSPRRTLREPRSISPSHRHKSRDQTRNHEHKRSPKVHKLESRIVEPNPREFRGSSGMKSATRNEVPVGTATKTSDRNERSKMDPSTRDKLGKDSAKSRSREDLSRSQTPMPPNNEKKAGGNKASGQSKQRSASSSSSDPDVLDLHPRRGLGRRSSLSPSLDSSTEEESNSDFSAKKDPGHNSDSESSDSSNATSSSEDEEDENTNDSTRVSAKIGKRVSKSEKNKTVESTKRKSSSRRKSKQKKKGSGDSDSESGSSSESEDEPRMTLSDRFAKLTQLSTDKREFAKLELSISDIDTKLKVVKNLRNSDTKIYLNGVTPNESMRPKSPEYFEGEARYSADDRRKHFEKMTRDEPEIRPNDWSDVRTRYSYYKERGYFDERPLSLEEFIKWEKWWFEYRDWLANEGYYGEGNDSDKRMGITQPPQFRQRHQEHPGECRDWRNYHGGDDNPRIRNKPYVYGHQRDNFAHSLHPPQRPEGIVNIRYLEHGRQPIRHNPDNRQGMNPRRLGPFPSRDFIRNVAPRNPPFTNGFRGTGRLAGRIGVRR